jgi:hypothetical protein
VLARKESGSATIRRWKTRLTAGSRSSAKQEGEAAAAGLVGLGRGNAAWPAHADASAKKRARPDGPKERERKSGPIQLASRPPGSR